MNAGWSPFGPHLSDGMTVPILSLSQDAVQKKPLGKLGVGPAVNLAPPRPKFSSKQILGMILKFKNILSFSILYAHLNDYFHT